MKDKINNWWKRHQRRKQLEVIRKFAFDQAIEKGLYSSILEVNVDDPDAKERVEWEIKVSLDLVLPVHLANEWEAAKIEMDEYHAQEKRRNNEKI